MKINLKELTMDDLSKIEAELLVANEELVKEVDYASLDQVYVHGKKEALRELRADLEKTLARYFNDLKAERNVKIEVKALVDDTGNAQAIVKVKLNKTRDAIVIGLDGNDWDNTDFVNFNRRSYKK